MRKHRKAQENLGKHWKTIGNLCKYNKNIRKPMKIQEINENIMKIHGKLWKRRNNKENQRKYMKILGKKCKPTPKPNGT